MSESNGDSANIMHSLGLLTGSVETMHQSLTTRMEDIKEDIRRLDGANTERMNRMEESLVRRIAEQGEVINKRIDGVDTRVSDLEKEDKSIIKEIAKYSFVGGGASAGLITAAVELMKKL